MDCILCSSEDCSTPNAKNVSLNELGILAGKKFIRSLCQLLDLPPLQFQDKFIQPDIRFCPSCIISLSNIWILRDQLEQLQRQIFEVKSHVTKLISDALKNDHGSHQTSSHTLRTQISKVLNLQKTNASIEETETVNDSLAIAIASISDTPSIHEHILGLETEPESDEDEEENPVSQKFTQILDSEKSTKIPIAVSDSINKNEENYVEKVEMSEEFYISPAWSPVSVTVDTHSDSDSDHKVSNFDDEAENETIIFNYSPPLPLPLFKKAGRKSKRTEAVKVTEFTKEKLIEHTRGLRVSMTRLEDGLELQGKNKANLTTTKQKFILKMKPPVRNRNIKTRGKPNKASDSNTKGRRPKSVDERDAGKTIPCTFSDCPNKFKSVLSRKRHLRLVHGEKPEVKQCPHCQKTFKKAQRLEAHVRIHTGEKPFFCETCGKGFRMDRSLRAHQTTVHNDGERPFPCSECPSAFISANALRAHVHIHTGEKPFACELCGECFAKRNYLTIHQTNSHPDELNLEPYKCKICSKIYKTQGYLNEHVRVLHSGDARVSCNLCSFRCDRFSRLKLHLLSHNEERPFQCTQCDKTYKYKAQLDVHMRLHTGERPFKCKSCPKAFTEMVKLKTHEGLHSDSKAFQCHLCGKSFPIQKYLTYHLKHNHLHHPRRQGQNPSSQSVNIVKLRDSKIGQSQDHEKVKGRRKRSQKHKVLVEEVALDQGEGQGGLIEEIEVLEVVPEAEHVQLEVYGVDLLR